MFQREIIVSRDAKVRPSREMVSIFAVLGIVVKTVIRLLRSQSADLISSWLFWTLPYGIVLCMWTKSLGRFNMTWYR